MRGLSTFSLVWLDATPLRLFQQNSVRLCCRANLARLYNLHVTGHGLHPEVLEPLRAKILMPSLDR